ncbi:MAG: acyl-CoA dehydrogenase family protein, partial [Calditrichaeota bacterium]|nr:acyl-CoA dehydrogenase family protein [Calditrichota bacterium]
MHFELSDEQITIQNAIRDFAREEIVPHVLEYDENKQFPAHLIAKMGELGLLGVFFPEEYGGAGMGYAEYAIILEE